MKHYKVKNIARQAGMTLIELSVVLLILVGLAGLLVPYVSGFGEKTHDSTTVSTLSELNNTIQRYQTTKMGLPSNLESLVIAAGTEYAKLPTTAKTIVAPLAVAAAAGPTDASFANASLYKAGITNVLNMNDSTDDATFKATTGTSVALSANPFDGTTGTALLKLTGDITNTDQSFYGQLGNSLMAGAAPTASEAVKNQLAYAFGGDPSSWDTACTNYIVMGIGSSNGLIPDAMQSAPVHFGGSKGTAPATTYSRFVGVFAVPNAVALSAPTTSNGSSPCMKPDAAAKFVGAAAVMDFPAIVGLNGAQQWSNSNLNK